MNTEIKLVQTLRCLISRKKQFLYESVSAKKQWFPETATESSSMNEKGELNFARK